MAGIDHEEVPSHQLRILVDPMGRKIADKLYEEYINRDKKHGARHPEFLLALDRLISAFSGMPLPDEEDDRKRPDEDEEDEYEPDQDIHADAEESSLKFLKREIAKLLRDQGD